MARRLPGHRLRRSCCPGLNRMLQSRAAALATVAGTAMALYYLRYYRGMSLHLELPGLSSGIEQGLDIPMPIPKFESLLPAGQALRQRTMSGSNKRTKNKNNGRFSSKGKGLEQQDLSNKSPTITKKPITRQQLRRRRGEVDYLQDVNVTILHSPNISTICATSRLLFVTGSSVLGDLPEAPSATATPVNLAEAARQQRKAVRDTWASSLSSDDLPEEWRGGCLVFYVLVRDAVAQQLLMEETRQTQDILILTASSKMLTDWSPRELDMISSAKVLFHLSNNSRRHPTGYTIRTNHKAFWNTKKLVGFLQGLEKSAEGTGAGNSSQALLRLAGKTLRSDWIHRDPLDPNYTSRKQFPEQMYPESALDNPGYIVSNLALKAMSNQIKSTPLVYYRETYLTGILRQKAGVELDMAADIKASRAVPVSPCHFRLFIATPTVEAQEMVNVWPQFTNANHKCSYTVIDDSADGL